MIPDEIVQETWREVAGFEEKQARKEMTRLGKRQTDLLGFVAFKTEDLSEGAHGLAIYLLFVVTRIFEKGGTVGRVSGEVILERFEQNTRELEHLAGAHQRWRAKAAADHLVRQPHVMRYVVEALMEAGDGPDPVELTDYELGILFLVLRTAVEVLDAALERKR